MEYNSNTIFKKGLSPSEEHLKSGSNIRDVILGFNDGLVSVFSVLAGFAGAEVSNNIVVLAGFAAFTAGAISMGLNNYISTKSQIEYYKSEIKREIYEIENFPERENKEVEDIYKAKGFRGELLKKIVNKITSNKESWLKIMMHEELGFFNDKFENPIKIALITGISFIVGAFIPLTPYFFFTTSVGLKYSILASITGLFIVGSLKTKFTRIKWWKSGLEMVLIGAVAALSTYMIGTLFRI